MSIDISQLPEKAQRQILQKLNQQETQRKGRQIAQKIKSEMDEPRKNKYGNQKADVCGIRFDSKREANRFLVLKAMLDRGEITDLRLQQNITLVEGFTLPDGTRIRPVIYKADFYYKDSNGQPIYEDAKGKRNQVYINKAKEIADKKGIIIREV